MGVQVLSRALRDVHQLACATLLKSVKTRKGHGGSIPSRPATLTAAKLPESMGKRFSSRTNRPDSLTR